MDNEKGLALWDAVTKSDLIKVKSLLKSKANPNFLPNTHVRPLLFVAIDEINHVEIVLELLKAGAHRFFNYNASIFVCCLDASANIYNALLYYGARMNEREYKEMYSYIVKKSKNVEQRTRISALLTAHDIMCERVARCRKACVAALRAAPFQQRDLKVWWVKMVVWPTRHDGVWTPDLPMPEGYT